MRWEGRIEERSMGEMGGGRQRRGPWVRWGRGGDRGEVHG